MSKGQVVILGVNGHIGRAVAEAFVDAGWDVTGMARTDKHLAGVRFVRGDADSVADMRAAIGDAEIVVNALNLPYHTWFNGRMEAQMGRVIEALDSTGKTVLFPGNIYNFAATDRVLTPELAQHPQTPRGARRVRVEAMFEAAARRGDIQAIILRAGDFYGPGATNDWFDQAIMTSAAKGKLQTLGTKGVGHAWAYLPDVGRAFAALFDPIMREVAKMAYLWRNPMELRDDKLATLLGEGFDTPFETAVAATVRPFFTQAASHRTGAEAVA
jgi:nucleoside-diphosphate-sugar epimerase